MPINNEPGNPLSLGISPCPNDTFIFHALIHGLVARAPAVKATYADIDVLNGMAERQALDVVKVSYGALPWLTGDYQLLRSGGALGRGCGPLVLSARPATRDQLRGARVAVPGERTTAYLLLRLANPELREIRVMPFDRIMPAVRDGEMDAGLVIHESRFTYKSYGLHQVMDLGEWWEKDTGLPIPLGAILARKSLESDRLAGIEAAIRLSLEAAWANPEASREFVMSHAQEMDPQVADAHIELYVNEFSRDLGEEGMEAVRTLLRRATDAGLTPETASYLIKR